MTTPQNDVSLSVGLRELHLFAGAGGGILGGMLLGHSCVCAVEIEPYCRKVLLQRQRDGILPRFPIWDDVRTFDGTPWKGRVDVVCGGFPCQDISIASNSSGGGAGLSGRRSGLWVEMLRIASEIRPGIIFVENSPMLCVRGLGTVLGDLAKIGYDSRWGVFTAMECGFLHSRERVFVYAYDNKDKHNRVGRTSMGKIEITRHQENGKDWNRRWRKLGDMGVVERACSYSEGRRIFYGMANGMDRMSAIGNGQVPAVVSLAWRTLMP